MPIIVNIAKDDLLNGLASLQNITAKKGTIAILSNVLISTGNDMVELTCTDLEIGMRCRLPAEILSPGSITLPCKKLFEIVREASCNHIHIEEKENSWVQVSVETGDYNIAGMESEEFPNFPEYNSDNLITVEAGNIQELIDKTIFSIANEGESQFTLTGVLVENKERDNQKFLRFVSSDGHRLTLMQVPMSADIDSLNIKKNTLIPRKGVQEMRKFCDGIEEVSFAIEEKQAVLKTERDILIIRLLNGDFPDYKPLVDIINREKYVEIAKEPLVHAFRRMNLFAEDKFNIVQFSLMPGKIVLSSQSLDIGNAREEIDVEYSGDELKLGFNGKYFLETLSVMKSDKVRVYISSNESPCMVLSENDPEFISIIMPMHL
ncbi:MAG: DNA polymerase III subunit beta [Proteobacteria bacterium]|nr:DNA polymerase III subunit beta [Pseudomonadota bacterium]MBU1639191.1 DNA polymerase III subunit beta [Pseudomonadota bacterium]